jgi:hypothetical protein
MDRHIGEPPPAPEPVDEAPLYAARRLLYPQRVRGTYRTIKWIVLAGTLAIYYLLPFVRFDRGPNAPHQAVLIDLPGRRFAGRFEGAEPVPPGLWDLVIDVSRGGTELFRSKSRIALR